MDRHTARAVVFAAGLLSSVGALPLAGGPTDFDLTASQGITARQDTMEMTTNGAGCALKTQGALEPGWYVLKGQCRTQSTGRNLTVEISGGDGKAALREPQQFQVNDSWSDVDTYFRVGDAQTVTIHIAPRKASPADKTLFKSLHIESIDLYKQENLIANGSFQSGRIGSMPAEWSWKNWGKEANYQLVSEKSFRTGDRVMQIQSADQEPRSIVSDLIPINADSQMSFSVWARSQDPNTSINLRLYTPDWKWQKDQSFALTPAWQKYTFTATLPKSPTAAYVYGRIDTPSRATVQLAAAEATLKDGNSNGSVNLNDNLQFTESDWLGVPGKNLLTNPGFELKGNGWVLDHFAPKKLEDAMVVGTSKACYIAPGQGLDGSAALYLTNGPALSSYCMPLKVGETYSMSAWVKPIGKPAEVWMACIEPGWKMNATLKKNLPADQWTRISTTFKFSQPSVQKRCYVRFNVSTATYLDNVQLQVGELTDFEAPPVTVGLIAPEKQDSIFVRGKGKAEALFRAIPAKGITTAHVDIAATDTWGREVWNRTVDLKGSPIEQKIELPTDKLGVFHVTCRATDASGKIVGLGRSAYAMVDPPAKEPVGEERYFGWCLEATHYGPWVIQRMTDWGSILGVRFNRFFFETVHTTPIPPSDYMAMMRGQCEPFKKADVPLIACFEPMPKSLFDRIGPAVKASPEDTAAFETNLAAVVSNFKGLVEYWEVMNEVNLWRYNEGPRRGQKAMDTDKYMPLLKAAAKAIHGADKDFKVVAPALNAMDWEFVQRMLDDGAAGAMDVFTVHPYRSTPDMPSVYDDLTKLKAQLAKGGFKGPIINGEQYFAANVFEIRASDDEAKRGYYVPGREQRRAAGRIVRQYVQHVAAGVPFALFSPENNLIKPDPDQDGFLFDSFGAYNAATRFLANAGRGKPLPLAGEMRAFFFPNAANGPLAVVYSIRSESDGRMRLPGQYEAFDMMGNRITQEEAAAGLRLSTDPVYIRYSPGATLDQITAAFHAADVLGMGEPMDAEVRITSPNELVLDIRNRLLKNISGKVTLEQLPADWSASTTEHEFVNIPSGQSAPVVFRLDKMPMKNLGSYPISFKATSGDVFLRTTSVVKPFFSTPASQIKIDGELGDWSNASWATLGEENLSRAFGTDPHTGPADLSARMASSWTPEGLYLAVEVTDDKALWPQSAAAMYNDDSLQVYFDQLNNAVAPEKATASQMDDDVAYSLGLVNGKPIAHLDKNPEGRYVGEANKSTGIDADVQIAIKRQDNKTIYEVFFPQRVLPQTRFEAGRSIGFALLINDNDGNKRKVGLTTTPKGTEPHGRPDMFVDLVLQAAKNEPHK